MKTPNFAVFSGICGQSSVNTLLYFVTRNKVQKEVVKPPNIAMVVDIVGIYIFKKMLMEITIYEKVKTRPDIEVCTEMAFPIRIDFRPHFYLFMGSALHVQLTLSVS